MSVAGVLVIKSVSDKKYILADRELPLWFLLKGFEGKEFVNAGELYGYGIEKISQELEVKPKTYEMDQKGIPKYLAGYVTLEEKQLRDFLGNQKDKLLADIRFHTDKVQQINNIAKCLENNTLV
jgi:hypothetical protein